jgi:catechol 2,3-dioxygenase-like lactoylglutathione lyase family enzyme
MKKTRTRLNDKPAKPVKTHGLSHLSLAVRDPERSLRFYQAVFGVKEYFRDAHSIQVLGPGRKDVLAFEKDHILAGKGGGLTHFGFRLTKPDDIDMAVALVESAGGKILSRGEFAPDSPYAFILDPDGYEIEIWYE